MPGSLKSAWTLQEAGAELILLQANDDGADVRLTGDELDMLNNVLNEMCNGVHIEDWEFQTRIGWARPIVQTLLDQIHEAAPNLN